MRDPQYWSKIVKAHLDEINKKERELHNSDVIYISYWMKVVISGEKWNILYI